MIGRSDTYGFNRLLHDHTSYSQVAVFPDSSQISYARYKYQRCSARFETESQLAGVCLDCLKEDIDILGFPYWRRDHRYVGVCAKHNTVISRKCPVCGRNIASHGSGYGHELLWEGCRGRYFHEYESEKNLDERQLAFAKIFAEIGESEIAIDLESVLIHLTNDVTTSCTSGKISKDRLSVIHWYLAASRRISDTRNDYRPDIMYSRGIIDAIAIVHGSFKALLDNLRSKGIRLRRIDELMRLEHPDRSRY